MNKFIVQGGKVLNGTTNVSGAKNVALKTLVAACLTSEKVTIENIPLISDFFVMVDIMKDLGISVVITDHGVEIEAKEIKKHQIPLDKAALARTSSMFISPLLARVGEAIIPNPGGCRLGARPIDRTIEGVKQLSATISYFSDDGYFHAKTTGLKGATYRFEKNTHTGTETLILTAVLAKGTTILENAAEEPEIDELIDLLNKMGAKVKRTSKRKIEIIGVDKLHGTHFRIQPDRNEIITFAIAAIITKGDVFIKDANPLAIKDFLEQLDQAHGGYEVKKDGIRFYYKDQLVATDTTTSIFPGFMTDWQAPWAVLMTQATGVSLVHETVFENKFGYVKDLKRMGAKIELFNPSVEKPEELYNFNLADDKKTYFHAIRVYGPTQLHDAVVSTIDIRAGAAIVLAALVAKGRTTIFGIEKLDRGYEDFEKRLTNIGASIKRLKEEDE